MGNEFFFGQVDDEYIQVILGEIWMLVVDLFESIFWIDVNCCIDLIQQGNGFFFVGVWYIEFDGKDLFVYLLVEYLFVLDFVIVLVQLVVFILMYFIGFWLCQGFGEEFV